MKRGEVWWVDFNPSIGGEIQKIRPAVIVSNDYSNESINRLQVVPITSNTDRCYPPEAYIHIKDKLVKAMADQLTTASKKRFKSKICQLSAQDLMSIEDIIKIQLDL